MLCKWDRSTMTVTQPRSAILVKSGATFLLISTQLASQFPVRIVESKVHMSLPPIKRFFHSLNGIKKKIDFIFGEIWGSQQKWAEGTKISPTPPHTYFPIMSIPHQSDASLTTDELPQGDVVFLQVGYEKKYLRKKNHTRSGLWAHWECFRAWRLVRLGEAVRSGSGIREGGKSWGSGCFALGVFKTANPLRTFTGKVQRYSMDVGEAVHGIYLLLDS